MLRAILRFVRSPTTAEGLAAACVKTGKSGDVGLILCLGVAKPERLAAIEAALRQEMLRTFSIANPRNPRQFDRMKDGSTMLGDGV